MAPPLTIVNFTRKQYLFVGYGDIHRLGAIQTLHLLKVYKDLLETKTWDPQDDIKTVTMYGGCEYFIEQQVDQEHSEYEGLQALDFPLNNLLEQDDLLAQMNSALGV